MCIVITPNNGNVIYHYFSWTFSIFLSSCISDEVPRVMVAVSSLNHYKVNCGETNGFQQGDHKGVAKQP